MKKGIKALIILGSVFGFIAASLTIMNVIPPSKAVETNPFIVAKGELPMLCAHRGGRFENPENTLKAFSYSVNELGVDVCETDLWLTSDNVLVLSHDGTINRTSDVEYVTGLTDAYYIKDHTYEELKYFNYGYQFENTDGERPYQDLSESGYDNATKYNKLVENKVNIVKFEDFLGEFYISNPDMLFIVEIKAEEQKGFDSADKIKDVLTNTYPDYINRVVVGTFHSEVEEYLEENCPTLMRGASTGGVVKFVVTQLFGVNIFDNSSFTCLQIPVKYSVIDLTWNTYIKRAHRRNIAVQYWTINDEDEMRTLIRKGVDCIMTDYPTRLKNVLGEFKD